VAKKKGDLRYPLERVRNIGIIAHIDAGKTTTTEQLLHYSGAQHRVGSVDDGNTTTDHMDQEQERGITIVSANVTIPWTPDTGSQDEHRINIIDTPGHIDFTAEVERALRVLDGAVAVYCGVAGVQAQSETVWRQANTYQIPRIAYINKLDRSGANFYDVFTDIEQNLEGIQPIAVQIPIGEEKGFRGVVDLVEMKAWIWQDASPAPPPEQAEIPDEVAESAELYRHELIERLANHDEEIENAFLEEQTHELTPAQLRAALRRATLSRKAYPVLCGASFRHKGAQPLLDAICHYLPAPPDRPAIQGKAPKGKVKKRNLDDRESWEDTQREPKDSEPFCALAFKTISSKTSDVTLLRVYSGQASKQNQLLNMRTNKKERLGGGIYRLHGGRRGDPLEECLTGDVVGVVGLRFTATGDTLCDANHPIVLGSITFPLPVVSMAVEPKSTKDKDNLLLALERMAKDDPTFTVRFDEETGQTVISGMGELHLEVIAERLKRDWKVEVKVGKPRVSYKVTVGGRASATDTYDLETGTGRRLFGEVTLEVEPMPKGSGAIQVEFPVSEEAIPDQFHEAIEDAIRSKATALGDWSDPLIDAKVRVTGGRYDPDASADAGYAAAASRAVEQACEAAGLTSLEPVMTLTVEAPEDFFGNVIQDLNGRRAEVKSTTPVKDRQRVIAAVPLAEVFGYASDIRSKTQGRADFTLEPRDYAPVPEGKRPKLW
jgi:elongation factor G